MGGRVRAGVSLLAVVCGLILSATGATAVAGEEAPEPEEAFTTFTLKGTHGYSALVLASAYANDGVQEAQAAVLISRRHSTFTMATPAKVTSAMVEGVPTVTSVRAGFGRLGRISVEYKSAGRQRIVRPSCTSERITLPVGAYEGTIEIHGEEGFTDFSATSVPARVDAYYNLICAVLEGRRGAETVETIAEDQPGAKLEIDTRAHPLSLARLNPGVRQLDLTVQENRRGGPVRVRAAVRERRGRLRIQREIAERVSGSAFAFAPDVSHARLSLDAPFAGRGVFEGAFKPRNRWRGNLTVDFPGRSNVRLTGPGLRASLVHARYRVEPFTFERLPRTFRALRPFYP